MKAASRIVLSAPLWRPTWRCEPLRGRRNLPLFPRRAGFHWSPPARLFGLRLPEPSNEPLAGTLGDASGPPWLFLLEVLVGLPAALWAYKCLMLVLFQRRIVYLPSVPPGTRDESLEDEERTTARDASLSGLDWRQVRIKSMVPTRWLRRPVELRGIEMSWSGPATTAAARDATQRRPRVVIVYLQGNAGTPLLRAPLFRSLLRDPVPPRAASASSSPPLPPLVTLLAIAPRTFWRSTRTTPTEPGVLADYAAALSHAYATHGPSARYVLYGHSLGGAAAVLLLEQLYQAPFAPSSCSPDYSAAATSPHKALDKASTSRRVQDIRAPDRAASLPTISGVILENPLPSIPHMVRALYPQRWLPYHYLGPFALDKWDALGRLERGAAPSAASASSAARARAPDSLWIRSGRDEIIPGGEDDGVRRMYDAWVRATQPVHSAREGQVEDEAVGSRAKWVDMVGALHDTAYLERRWRDEIRSFLVDVASRER